MRALALSPDLRMRSRGRFALAAVRATVVGSLLAAIALSAAGCAGLPGSPVSVAVSEAPGFPRNAPVSEPLFDDNWRGEPIAWLDDDRETITVVSYGSSTCPLVATAITVIDDSTVSIDLRQAPAQACTDDLAPYTHVLAVPAGWGQGEGPYAATVTRALDAFGPTGSVQTTAQLWPWPEPPSIAVQTLSGLPDDIILPADALDKGAPLAFWGPGRASLRVITWGSSSCPPPALSLDLTSSTELALVFGALPPRACTADFAPTTHVFGVPDGLDPDTVFLTITIELSDAPRLQFRLPIAE
ncbi:hypothetical protein [Microcella sp.]|uniref:hypothetical protein n=1 Tax=Microcella sp. TaxID=1913979 RepID=UPI00299F66E3|nr:hypothetical protein [Microcella sp.]MDX2025330.1 hypothetical protein [Microcella sp.]